MNIEVKRTEKVDRRVVEVVEEKVIPLVTVTMPLATAQVALRILGGRVGGTDRPGGPRAAIDALVAAMYKAHIAPANIACEGSVYIEKGSFTGDLTA